MAELAAAYQVELTTKADFLEGFGDGRPDFTQILLCVPRTLTFRLIRLVSLSKESQALQKLLLRRAGSTELWQGLQ